MASSLSEDEFQRMQTQLLELRESNYQLDDSRKRQENEILVLRSQLENLDRENQKALRTLNKSKKAREYELILQEVDGLQGKLMSQEEEFRLQNQTLMQELGQMVVTIENLEKENEGLKSLNCSSKTEKPGADDLQDEVRRLQAQNSALQKNLQACQEIYDTDISNLRKNLVDMETQCIKLSGQRGDPVGQGSNEIEEEESTNKEINYGQSSDQPDGKEVQRIIEETAPDITLNLTASVTSTDFQPNTVDQYLRQINDLKLNLDTEAEEKKMLREQLLQLDNMYKDQTKSLQDEVSKHSEKFKKKQESLVRLQEEKEKMFTELSGKLEDAESVKANAIQQLQTQCDKLQQQVSHANQILETERSQNNRRIQELQDLATNLQGQVKEANAESSSQLQDQTRHFQGQVQELNLQIASLQEENKDLQSQLQEIQMVNQQNIDHFHGIQKDLDVNVQQFQEANRVAEKRKSLLDELAIKYQTENDQHRELVKSLEAQIKQLDEQNHELQEQLTSKTADLEDTRETLEAAKAMVSSLENTKGWLERRLNESEEANENTKADCESRINTQIEEHQESTTRLRNEQTELVEQFETKVSTLQSENDELGTTIIKLRQDIKDMVDDKKLHEKKGMTVVKDLKRQLHGERKRAEKLQERIQELLADSKDKHSVEELFRQIDTADRIKGDSSSVSSWNTSLLSKDNTASPEEEVSPGLLERENSDLLKRITALQEEKWTIDEKLNHLEESNASMAEDLLMKTAIIEHYVMDSKTGHSQATSPSQERLSLRKVMDYVMDNNDETLRDINRKLHHMLEETLTKNMHLQKDMETLSHELARSQEAGQSQKK